MLEDLSIRGRNAAALCLRIPLYKVNPYATSVCPPDCWILLTLMHANVVYQTQESLKPVTSQHKSASRRTSACEMIFQALSLEDLMRCCVGIPHFPVHMILQCEAVSRSEYQQMTMCTYSSRCLNNLAEYSNSFNCLDICIITAEVAGAA